MNWRNAPLIILMAILVQVVSSVLAQMTIQELAKRAEGKPV